MKFSLLFPGTIYDEFQYRRPPPSYNASMQEYQRQLVLAQIQQSTLSRRTDNTPNSPPPTYKSHASTVRPGLHITFPILQGDDYPSSRPPTYRSTAGTLNRPRINTNPDENPGENERTEGGNNRGTEANQEQIMNERNSNHSRPETPASSSLTLQRANQVVNYLDDVLDNSIREMERGDANNTQESSFQPQGQDRNDSANVGGNGAAHSASTASGTITQLTSAGSEDSDGVPRDRDTVIIHSSNSTVNARRDSTTTTVTTSSNNTSSGGSSSSDTSTSTSGASSNNTCTSEDSNRNSSSSQNSGNNSHIVADTHLWYLYIHKEPSLCRLTLCYIEPFINRFRLIFLISWITLPAVLRFSKIETKRKKDKMIGKVTKTLQNDCLVCC